MRYRKLRIWMLKRIHQQWPDAPVNFWNTQLFQHRRDLQDYLYYKWIDDVGLKYFMTNVYINGENE